jgi:hypothetical protein
MALYSDGVHYRCSADMYVPSLYGASPPCVTCNQHSINMKIIFKFTSANQKNTIVSIRRCSFSFTSRKTALNDYAFDYHLIATRLSYDCCILGGGSHCGQVIADILVIVDTGVVFHHDGDVELHLLV